MSSLHSFARHTNMEVGKEWLGGRWKEGWGSWVLPAVPLLPLYPSLLQISQHSDELKKHTSPLPTSHQDTTGHWTVLWDTFEWNWMKRIQEVPWGLFFFPSWLPSLLLPFICSKTSSRCFFLKLKWMKIHRTVWFTWVNALFELYWNPSKANYRKNTMLSR